jgi:outer membrane protein OmpA-like peptidoglycan-associated protein
MKIVMIALSLTLLAGCTTVVPLAPYYVYGPYPPVYYNGTATDNDYYSSGYYTPRYSGYYEPHGYGYYYPNQAYAYAPPRVYRSSPAVKRTSAVLQPIYFDLNESTIRFDAAKTLRKNLAWFRQNPGRKISILGNCDPRASGQYNLALGQRRAEATKKQLVALGVEASRLEAVSYGEGRPTCREQDEFCWAKERRVDFEPMP